WMFFVVFILLMKAIYTLGKLAWKQWWMIPISLLSFALAYFNLLTPAGILLLSSLMILSKTWMNHRKRK
ncbi:MAG: hypothetical protein FJ352_04485, partial [Firmicutes bacterium]|nr:hypothetical protein [Bacillota bacterium]